MGASANACAILPTVPGAPLIEETRSIISLEYSAGRSIKSIPSLAIGVVASVAPIPLATFLPVLRIFLPVLAVFTPSAAGIPTPVAAAPAAT